MEEMLTMTYKWTERNPAMDDFEGDHWRVTLRNGPRRMTLTYSKGYGHKGAPPTLAEVAGCLESDATIAESCPTFADFCAEYGYDEDSRKAEKVYRLTLAQAERWNAIKDAETVAIAEQ